MRIILMMLALFAALLPQAHAKRVALLIGNAAYQHEGRLANPINDAKLLARTLQDLGFDEVKLIENADMRQLTRAVDQFERSAQGADTAVVYFSGHGQQTEDQQNYLLAVDADIEQPADLKHDAITSDSLMQATAGAKVRLVILDACRDRPASTLTRSATKGLSRARDPSRAGLLIAYATEDGKVAQDGTAGQNSPYAAALAQAISKRDKPILAMLDDVADQVAKATQYSQNPTRSGNLRVDVYLVAPQININQATTTAPDAELVFWDSVKNATEAADYIAYLEQYPQGRFKTLAKARIQKYSPVYASLMLDDTPSPIASPTTKPADRDAELMAQGMWRDPKTNMIWMRCSLGQTWNGTTCTGEASPHTWRGAQYTVAVMNRNGGYAGYTDWVLPHIEDLSSIRYCSTGFKETREIPAKRGGNITIDGKCRDWINTDPMIDKVIFPNTPARGYWSASTYAGMNNNAWHVSFGGLLGIGDVYGNNKGEERHVRAVRAGHEQR